jgi:uncharacterized membrane protein YtjA (UPF0391 family)
MCFGSWIFCLELNVWAFVQFTDQKRRRLVLSWALIFFIVAIAAAVLGFGGLAAASASIAKILFFIFLVLFVISLVMGLGRGTRPPLA